MPYQAHNFPPPKEVIKKDELRASALAKSLKPFGTDDVGPFERGERAIETSGRERVRYGSYLPKQLTAERRRGLEEGGPSRRTIRTGHRKLRKEKGRRAS